MAKHRKIKHYSHSYRAKKKRQQGIFKAILFLLLLAVLVFLGYSIAQSLGDLLREEPQSSYLDDSSLPPDESSERNSEPDSSGDSSSPESSDAPGLIAPAQPVKAAAMPADVMLSPERRADFLSSLDKELYNTVALTLKDSAGKIYYQTELELAANSGALWENALDAAALAEEIKGYDLEPAAIVYSLQDDFASHARYGTSYLYQNQSITWLDNAASAGGRSWLNPYMDNTKIYLSAIAEELADAGFAELFVFGNQYPNASYQKDMGLGVSSSLSRAEALEEVLALMQQSAGEGCRVIPAYQGDCYDPEVRPHVYTVSPNEFALSPSAPIIGGDLGLLEAVTAPPEELIPVVSSSASIEPLHSSGIEQYLVQ